MVRIYLRGELVKVHPVQSPGSRSTDYGDYPAHKTAYAMRDPERIVARAAEHAPGIGEFAGRLLAGDFPWAKLRQAQKLLRLVDKYGAARAEAACRRALSFDLINVARVEAILERGLEIEASKPREAAVAPAVAQLSLRFARPPESFRHHVPNTDQPQEIADGD